MIKRCLTRVHGENQVTGMHDGIRGDVSGLRGDVSGLRGNVSGLSGDVDACEITDEMRCVGVDVADLVVEVGA